MQMRFVLPILLTFVLNEPASATLLKKILSKVSSVVAFTVLTPPATPSTVPAPTPIPVASPASPTQGFNPSSIADHRVLLRTFYKEINQEQAQEIDLVLEETLANYTAVSPSARKLRASRNLQSFCKKHCNDPKYGCKWCKLNDVYIGANCNNYCRRQEAEGNNPLPGNDELATSYVSNRNRFTPEQDKICAELLASIELASDVVDAPIAETQCYLVPRNFTILGS